MILGVPVTSTPKAWRTPLGRCRAEGLSVCAVSVSSGVDKREACAASGRKLAQLQGRSKRSTLAAQIGSLERDLTATQQPSVSPSLVLNVLSYFLKPDSGRSQKFNGNEAQFHVADAVGRTNAAFEPLLDLPESLQDVLPSGDGRLRAHSLPIELQLWHPTLQLMKKRLESGSEPGKRRDGFKLGLVVEGGGMKGVITGGMLKAILELGLESTLDTVYGSSAGAINATYFLSKQPWGLDIYSEDIANETFIKLRRFLGPEPLMNLDYLIDHVMKKIKPLDWQAVLDSPIPLKVVASSLDSLTSVVLHDFSTPDELAESLKASANVPDIAGPPRTVGGHRLVDGAVFEPVPYQSAINDGCTHILALCSRTHTYDETSNPIKRTIKDAINMAMDQFLLSPPYMKAAAQARSTNATQSNGAALNDLVLASMLQGLRGTTPEMGAQILPIYPPSDVDIGSICIEPLKLKQGQEEGRLVARHILERALGGC